MRFPRLSRVVVAIVVALIASLVAVGATTTSASAAETGKVRGAIYAGKGLADRIQVTWFDSDWHYIGKRKLSRGVYSLRLRTGTYWLQFTDLRPVYDVTRYAPTNVKVTVRSGRTATKTVHMHRGAAITGVVKAGGKPAGGARIVAANTSEQSFSVNANSKGQFAVGGLPAGSYSVFSYDRAKKWVGKSLWVPGMLAYANSRSARSSSGVRARPGWLPVAWMPPPDVPVLVSNPTTSSPCQQWTEIGIVASRAMAASVSTPQSANTFRAMS